MIREWLVAFALTQAIEAPIYVRGARARWAEALSASALTHPFVWFVIPWLVDLVLIPRGVAPGERWFVMFAVAETFAILAEGSYMKWIGRPRPLLWSSIANATSVTVGLVIYELMG
jgi:hypothetical protein